MPIQFNKYIYDPYIDNHWSKDDVKNFDSLPKGNRPLYKESIRKFFENNPDLKDAINNNDWTKVFNRWEGFSEDYVAEVLAFFLQEVCGIEFMKYLQYPEIYSFWEANLIPVTDTKVDNDEKDLEREYRLWDTVI